VVTVGGALEEVARRAWNPHSAGEKALRAALVPAAVAYGAATALRNRLYDGGWLRVERVGARVVSVGNISVGGTGKTPAALWLAQGLIARGARAGIVARGYRKERAGVVVVGVDGRPLVSPAEGGDEAVMLARRFRGPVVTGERRAEAAAFACERFALDTIVLDDGFQHRGLARDADLVLLGPERDGGWSLPAGPLRESVHGLRRARAVLVLDDGGTAAHERPCFRGRMRATAVVRVAGDEWVEEPLATLAGRPVVAVAGVARPERFVATLERSGARVGTLLRFPDHHAYTERDAATIREAAGTNPVVTTEKDLVKLAGLTMLEGIRALRVTLEVEEGEALLDLLTRP
jgi:tetraacyldisaccharide 4'-kinase